MLRHIREHFRIGIGGDTQTVAEGLERLSAALDELGKEPETNSTA